MGSAPSRCCSPYASAISDQEEILWELERDAPSYNDWLLSRAVPFVGEHVLEVGAGIGTFTLLLAGRGIRVTALEPEDELAAILEERTRGLEGVRVFRETIGDLQSELLDKKADSIISFNVLEHIPDDRGALEAMRGFLRPGGQLLLVSPAHPFLFGATDRAVDHERRYTKDGLGTLLRDSGYEVADLRYVNPIGAAGWLVSSRLLRRSTLPRGPLKVYERLVPALRTIDRMQLPFGLSVWARAVRPT
jgi:SAM-dependent methyltransferase